MPAAKLFGEPSRLSQNVGHRKCMFLFWNGKRKSGNFLVFPLFIGPLGYVLSTF